MTPRRGRRGPTRESIRGGVVRRWQEARRPPWDLERTLAEAKAVDEELEKAGRDHAPKFRQNRKAGNSPYIRTWVLASGFDWLKPRKPKPPLKAEGVVGGIPVGATFKSQRRTISEGEFTLLHDLVWATGHLHTDQEHMAQTPFGNRILAGNVVLALMGGLAEATGLFETILPQQHSVDLVALIAYEDVRFRGAVLPGDTIRCTFEITEARPTSKPGRGVIKVKGVCTKQGDQPVAEATQVFLFDRRRAAPGTESKTTRRGRRTPKG